MSGIFKINPNTEVPAEKRKLAYSDMLLKQDGTFLLPWENDYLTVDEANNICSAYRNEGNSKADEIQLLIISAKEYIRTLYPDENV